MHIVLAMLSGLAGLIWALVALQRSGFNPDALNPFLWLRRTRWRKQYYTDPLFLLKDPMEAAAVLLLATAKSEGEISREQKHTLQQIFVNEFRLSESAAAELMQASAYLIRNEVNLQEKVDRLLAASSDDFTPEQATSLLSLMSRVAGVDSPINEQQRQLIVVTGNFFERLYARTTRWKPGSTAS